MSTSAGYHMTTSFDCTDLMRRQPRSCNIHYGSCMQCARLQSSICFEAPLPVEIMISVAQLSDRLAPWLTELEPHAVDAPVHNSNRNSPSQQYSGNQAVCEVQASPSRGNGRLRLQQRLPEEQCEITAVQIELRYKYSAPVQWAQSPPPLKLQECCCTQQGKSMAMANRQRSISPCNGLSEAGS